MIAEKRDANVNISSMSSFHAQVALPPPQPRGAWYPMNPVVESTSAVTAYTSVP
jgi:hypothetical protein